jgi:hypothetical protein
MIRIGCGGGGSRTARDVTWGVTEVATWLEALQLSEYAESFTRNDIHGRELLTLVRRHQGWAYEKDTAGCQGPHHVILMEADCSGGQSSP